jgi:dTDP-4-amino-4,6-dideoxygalactose transaminase
MSSFGLQENGSTIPPLDTAEQAIYDRELSSLEGLTIQQICERVTLYEKAQRELFLKLNVAKTKRNKIMASLDEEGQDALAAQGFYVPNRKSQGPKSKPKISETAKAYKKSVALFSGLGMEEKDMQAMLARLRQTPATLAEDTKKKEENK